MKRWRLNPDYAAGESGTLFADLDAVFAVEGEYITSDPLSTVHRVRAGSRYYYVKRYEGAGKNLRRYLGRPRVQAEWENLLNFRAWGIPTATVVGFGMERCGGAFHRGALITEELINTTDLAEMVQADDSRLHDGQWVRHVSRQVAWATRALHAQRFAHNDLKWRNILVDQEQPANIYLIDCPGGTFWWGPFLERRKIKDLACLDKPAKHVLSRTQRLRFYLMYTGQARLSQQDRKRIAAIVNYFEGRE